MPGLWLLALAGLALVLLCGRRLGPLVREPLPVVVRATESTREPRAGSTGVPATATTPPACCARPPGVGWPRRCPCLATSPWPAWSVAAAHASGRTPDEVGTLLEDRPVPDDSALADLGRGLLQIENEVRTRMTQPDQTQPDQTQPDPAHAGEEAREALSAVRREVAKAVVGQDAAVSALLVALLARGHVLMEGVPGVAKTLLVRTLAAALSIDTKRVQFTPDLMPGDLTGSMVIEACGGRLAFREGPVFTNLLLADEINRTPPKTQSALLEAMEEGQVSADGVTRRAADAVPGRRDAEPGRVRGHLPAARGPAGPVPAQGADAAARAGRRGRDRAPARRRVRPARRRRGRGDAAWPTAAHLAAGAAAVGTVRVSDEVAGYVVDVARATRRRRRCSSG